MLTVEASATTSGTPEAVWAEWIDVERWAEGEALESAEIDGAFAVGATIRTKAKGFPKSTLKVTHVDKPRLWIDESRAPGMRMTFEHLVESQAGETKITERALISGPLAPVAGRLVRRKLAQLLATSTADLAQRTSRSPEQG